MVNKSFLELETKQHTLAQQFSCSGVGLHSGEQIKLTVKPAKIDAGICFYRTDITDQDNKVEAVVGNVVDTKRGTSLANADGVRISTVEHLLASLLALGVDNARIEVDGAELPAMDGSAAIFSKLIIQAGREKLSAPRKFIRVLREVIVDTGKTTAQFLPYDGFNIDVGISYENLVIGEQSICFDVNQDFFLKEIAKARTFALRSEVDAIYQSGKGAGGSLANCIIVGEGAIENQHGLWRSDEFVRHKAIDVLGDLSLAGGFLLAKYKADRVGHQLNVEILQALLSDQDAWEICSIDLKSG